MTGRIVLVTLIGLLLSGCSMQVSGMQNPAARDWGELEWMPVNRELEQPFVVGSGHGAAIHNDALTPPDEYIDNLAKLPADATSGEFLELRVPLRLRGDSVGPWETGTRLQLIPADVELEWGDPFLDVVVDTLPRTHDRVVITELPDLQAGDVVVIRLIPGDGPQRELLDVGITPHRAAFGGWRMTSKGEMTVGSMAFEARYMREVDSAGVITGGVDRMADGGAGFLTIWGVVVVAAGTGVALIGRTVRKGSSSGR